MGLSELVYLYDHSRGRELENFELQAAIHGIDLKKDSKESSPSKPPPKPVMFQDPKEYENLTPEEREEMTQSMMRRLRGFVQDPVKYATSAGGTL